MYADYEDYSDVLAEKPTNDDYMSVKELTIMCLKGIAQFTFGTAAFLAILYFVLGFGTWQPIVFP